MSKTTIVKAVCKNEGPCSLANEGEYQNYNVSKSKGGNLCKECTLPLNPLEPIDLSPESNFLHENKGVIFKLGIGGTFIILLFMVLCWFGIICAGTCTNSGEEFCYLKDGEFQLMSECSAKEVNARKVLLTKCYSSRVKGHCCTDNLYHTQSEIDQEGYTKSIDESKCIQKECFDNCPSNSSPVCGTDGKTYANACMAKCNGVSIKKQGSCREKIPEEIMVRYQSVALNKIKSLEKYLQTITNKSKSKSDRDYAFDEAINLFTDEAIIEVSSIRKNKPVISYDVKDYLNHLKNLSYSRIEVEWSEIAYVSDFTKVASAENRYEAVATIYQKFTGIGADNKPIYEDITKKNMKVVLEKMTSTINGKKITAWDVFLGDTTVKNTTIK